MEGGVATKKKNILVYFHIETFIEKKTETSFSIKVIDGLRVYKFQFIYDASVYSACHMPWQRRGGGGISWWHLRQIDCLSGLFVCVRVPKNPAGIHHRLRCDAENLKVQTNHNNSQKMRNPRHWII